MIDEKIWLSLSKQEKTKELQSYLDQIIAIDEGRHELSSTTEKGKLAWIKKDLIQKVYKIIEIENPS